MQRMYPTRLSREECIRRAEQQEWMSRNCPTEEGMARCFAQARYWRSQALVARRQAEIDSEAHRSLEPL